MSANLTLNNSVFQNVEFANAYIKRDTKVKIIMMQQKQRTDCKKIPSVLVAETNVALK